MDLNEFFRSLTLSVIITDFMALVFHSKCTLCPILFRAATANQENLKAYQVVPQLFKKFPPREVKVEYEHGRKVDFGTIFSEDEIDNPPNKISWTVERKYERAKSRFALGMFGN
nr:PREDICTED: uncharacterized protein LOC109040267 [Bemisia tabaci]